MSDVAQLMRAANPVSDSEAALTDDDFDALLLLTQSRSGNVDAQELTKPVEPEKKQRSGWLVAAAAFAVVIVFVGAVMLLANPADELPPAITPPTTQALTPTTVATATTEPTVTPAEAIALANAWYVARNAGDVDAVIALYAPDATVGNTLLFGYGSLEDEHVLMTWNAAQGTTITTKGCIANDPPGPIQNIRCDGAIYDAIVQAVGAPPVTANIAMTIGPDGITNLLYAYGQPDFNHVADPFDLWMQANHPTDASSVEFGSWSTIEEAEVSGVLVAQYAAEWAAYLEANDCTYLDGC